MEGKRRDKHVPLVSPEEAEPCDFENDNAVLALWME